MARWIVLVALVLVGAAPAHATPADRNAAIESYLALRDATQVAAGWNGSVDGCVQGTESDSSIDATLLAVNRLRDFAGVGPVIFDAELNRKALAAALMMDAANDENHTPEPGWPCYTLDGDEGAGRSNLFADVSGPSAMIGYIDEAKVPSLGHRRWLLDPRGSTYGTGSTGGANALLVIGAPPSTAPVPEIVGWPPAGFAPWPLVFADWSAAISTPGSIDSSGATVTVAVDGETRSTSGVTTLEDGFGTGRTIKWKVALTDADRGAVHHVAVTIANVLVDGAPRSFDYAFEAFPVLPPVPGRFGGSRTGSAVSVMWEAATERGVPVTGYRIVGTDGGSFAEFDRTVAANARTLTIPYAQPNRTLTVRVIPLSRAGSLDVAAITVPAATPSGGDMAGERSDPGLFVRRIFTRGKRLTVTVRISKLASRYPLVLRLRGDGRSAGHTTTIRAGRARFNVRVPAKLRQAAKFRARLVFAGNDDLLRAAELYTFTRRRDRSAANEARMAAA